MNARDRRHWALFVDWCTAAGLPSLPTNTDVIAAFLSAFPAAIDTQGRRVRAIRVHHEQVGHALSLPVYRPSTALRTDDGHAGVHRALAQLPKWHHPKHHQVALRGRRDGWLLVLIGIVGLSRRAAREVTAADVTLSPTMSIGGVGIPSTESALECPACAVTRWLRIVAPATFRWWGDVKALVSPEDVDPHVHDCEVPLDESWREAVTLLPTVDRHGWVTSVPMSLRGISAVMSQRQELGEIPELPRTEPRPTSGAFSKASMDQLADAYDDVDQRAAAMLLLMRDLIGETDEALANLSSAKR